MAYAKNYQNKKSCRADKRSSKAYKPKPPFRTVEGIESLSWNKLSPHGVFLLLEFYRKFDGYNRFNLMLSYNELREKISNGTFSKAIWELIGFGFIDVKRFGRLERNNSIYALSNRWMNVSRNAKRLDKIENLLAHIEKVKHINTPSDFNESKKSDFRMRRKQLLWKIRNKVLGG